jgi:ATP-dependent HslUV protease ATP-binding subunit HslU
LTGAPFIKVEASKFTEVGYVGRNVESIIRELTAQAVAMVKKKEEAAVREKARIHAEEHLLDLLLPPEPPRRKSSAHPSLHPDLQKDLSEIFNMENNREETDKDPETGKEREGSISSGDLDYASTRNLGVERDATTREEHKSSREKLRERLRAGKLDKRFVEIDSRSSVMPVMQVASGDGIDEMILNIQDMLGGSPFTGRKKKKKVTVPEALEILTDEEAAKLIDMDAVVSTAIKLVEQEGIVFLDELDKIAGREGNGRGPDVSREGVQRDLLPIIEGSTVSTKYGNVKTDHILFIAAGAFHVAKVSDLIPEIQGRFPIRVALSSLGREEFLRILTEPENSLIIQYTALLATEHVKLIFTDDAVREISSIAVELNKRSMNIGARRLHAVMEKLLDDISFDDF